MAEIIRIDINDSRSFDAESGTKNHTPIQELIDWLVESKDKGATHIDWYARAYDSESEEVEAQPFYEREETPEELDLRLKQIENNRLFYQQQALLQEKQTYLKLKKKFEGS